MTRSLSFRRTLLLGAMVGLFSHGCLSPQILDDRSEYAPTPATQVELRLRRDPPADVLVLYDEVERKTGRTSRRAFFLFANEERLTAGKRPKFVNPAAGAPLRPVPLLREAPSDPQNTPDDVYALSPLPPTIALYSRGHVLAEFELPAYGNWLTTKKFFLFPLAFAADAAGIGTAVGVWGGFQYLQGGKSFRFP